MSKTHIAVLMGGLSSEREVSLSSGKSIAQELKTLGYQVTEVDAGRDLAAVLTALKPDLVFNALHGTYGEDGKIPGLLEVIGIPYTHSGVLSSALGFNKTRCKDIAERHGVACPEGKIVSAEEVLAHDPLPRPFVIKPNKDGSSVDVYIVTKETKITPEMLKNHKAFLVERYIPGRELSVACTDEEALGVIELKPKDGFYDYAHKYTDNVTEHIFPAILPEEIYQQALRNAFAMHQLLGCRAVSRSDFRYDEQGDGKLYFLEINTHPGMTSLSLVPEIAAHKGISFPQLLEYIVQKALSHGTEEES